MLKLNISKERIDYIINNAKENKNYSFIYDPLPDMQRVMIEAKIHVDKNKALSKAFIVSSELSNVIKKLLHVRGNYLWGAKIYLTPLLKKNQIICTDEIADVSEDEQVVYSFVEFDLEKFEKLSLLL